MKIAILGTRGIPANYGGFETFAEELSVRLVQKGHDVTVYGRSNIIDFDGDQYRGVHLVIIPTISHKYFDTVAHTFLSVLHCLKQSFDVVLICNSVNSCFSWIPRLSGTRVALNVDGLEWQRAKWNKIGQWVYRFSEFLATLFPNHVVTDSKTIQKYYWKHFHKKSTFIPYGSPSERVNSKEVLKKFHVKPDDYVLYVSRLEPENNAHHVVKAFEKVKTDKKLIVVGDAPYNQSYIQSLKSTRDPRIIFTGYVFGNGYHEFQSHAYCYVQATEVGGTHPALLEGMGYGNCILAHDVPEHREVLAEAGHYYRRRDVDDLTEQLQYLLDHPEKAAYYRSLASKRAYEKYSWDKVTQDYERLFQKMIQNGGR
jgi:glycosyltransferase involved in cell wall biosynthesis